MKQDTIAGVGAAAARAVHEYEIVVVAYRGRALVTALLASLPPSVPVVVVDNARGADGLPDAVATRPRARYLEGPGRGFAAAANLGAMSSAYETVVFVDPDTSPNVGQLDCLVESLQQDGDLAAVCGLGIAPDGRVELGVGGWEPTPGRALVHAVGLHCLWPLAGLWSRPVPGRPIELDWLGGACMAMPLRHFRALGGFDETYYVYNEDVDFGRRIRAAGLRQLVRTDVLIPHAGAGSSGVPERMLRQRGASMTQYVRLNGSRASAEATRAALSLGALLRCLVALITAKPATVRPHVAYLAGLWRGGPDWSDHRTASMEGQGEQR